MTGPPSELIRDTNAVRRGRRTTKRRLPSDFHRSVGVPAVDAATGITNDRRRGMNPGSRGESVMRPTDGRRKYVPDGRWHTNGSRCRHRIEEAAWKEAGV